MAYQGLVHQQTSHIDIEVLLLFLLLADMLNGIVAGVVGINCTQNMEVSQTGFALPLVSYILIGLVFLIVDCITIYKDKRKNSDNSLCPSKVQGLKLVIKIIAILGGACYYVGDNIQTITRDDTGVLPLVLSVSAVLSYRILPLALRKLIKYCKDGENTNKNFNWCSPNSSETHTLVVAYVYLLTVLIEFDVVLTAVLKKVDNNINLCNRTKELNTLWGFYGSMVSIFVAIESAIFAVFIVTEWHNSRCFRCLPKFELTLSSRGRPCPLILCNIVLFVTVTFAIILFLLADNPHLLECSTCTLKDVDCSTCIRNPLDCSKCTSKPLESILRVSFLSFSLVVCSVVIFAFLFRICCCCVQVKGNFTSVDVQENGQLSVNFQDKVWKYRRCSFDTENKEQSFTYEMTNSDITSDFNHAELYKKDIEHAVKHVGYFSQVTVANLANNQMAVVHNIEEEPYLLFHSNNNPSNMCKVRTRPPGNGWNKDEEPLARYLQCKQYSVYKYLDQDNEKYCAVEENTPAPQKITGDVTAAPVRQKIKLRANSLAVVHKIGGNLYLVIHNTITNSTAIHKVQTQPPQNNWYRANKPITKYWHNDQYSIYRYRQQQNIGYYLVQEQIPAPQQANDGNVEVKNHQDNQIAMIHNIDEKRYLVVHSTNISNSTNVYQIQKLPIQRGWVRVREEPIVKYDQYSIYLYQNEDQEICCYEELNPLHQMVQMEIQEHNESD